jgi:prepilin-type N-terminal cleavage/methylation domain-containing protein
MKKFNCKINKYNKGFTLVELMVSMAIFMMIMLAAMGSLFVSLNAIRNIRAEQTAIDSVNYAIESMSRSIRLGTKYHSCDIGCPSDDDPLAARDSYGDNSIISFVPQNYDEIGSKRITYQKNGKTLERCIGNDCASIVSDEVTITKLRFDVKGAEDKDPNYHPRVYILVGGEVTIKGSETTTFAIQTIAAQRNLK